MKNLFVFFLFLFHTIPFFSQEVRPEISGTLKTGELLTGKYNGNIFLFGNSYVWHTAKNASGTGIREVGKYQVYRIRQEDAGNFIRFGVTTFSHRGEKDTYYSSWEGPVRNSIPVIKGKVTVSGTLRVNNTLSASYHYSEDNYPESGTTFRWYLAGSSSGANAVLISSSGSTLRLLPFHETKYIRVEVTPRDINGNTGDNYTSSWYGPVQRTEEPNGAPVATNVRIRGNPVYCGELTGIYDYADPELDPEGQSTFRWLRASADGGSPAPIPGATAKTYTVSPTDKGMKLYFEVTPKAASGTSVGTAVMSPPGSIIQGNLPSVTFSGGKAVCDGSSTVLTLTFSGIPPFTLEYTNGSKNFNLSTSNYTYSLNVNSGGTYQGTRLTDILNCPVTDLPSSAEVTVKPKPHPDFTVNSTCFTGDTTFFRNSTPSGNMILSWSWNFGDANSPQKENRSAAESPGHKYASSGKYLVSLVATDANGCKDSIIKPLQLGEKPNAGLTWDRECYADGLTTTFKSISRGADPINKYQWAIRKESSLLKTSSESGFSFAATSPGDFLVSLKIGTALGCDDSIQKMFRIKPVIHLKDSMYSDSFEKTAPFWSPEQVPGNYWICGMDVSHSGKYSWYTVFPEKRKNQQLVISGPCFDFTGLTRPFINIWIKYKSQETEEGAVLQYLQDGDTDWMNVGDAVSGVNWYNHDHINAQPGAQNSGWSGNSGGWLQARHSLEFLSDKSNIRFRIVYGGSANDISEGSFAFDDVFIGDRGKKVLVEHFTNLSDALSMQATLSVDSVLMAAGLNSVGIQYHTSFPGPDSLNDQNKANPAARALYYGVGKVPVSYLDGGTNASYIFDYQSKKMNVSDISNRSFEDPGFDLSITSSVRNQVVEGNVRTTALMDHPGMDISLYIAILEDVDILVSGKIQTLRNVLRYIYPSSAGLQLPSAWAKGQAADVSFSWPITHTYDLHKLKTVAFIQDNRTKEVYQVNLAVNSTVTASPPLMETDGPVKVYPNPARGKIIVSFGKELRNDCHIQVVNPQGKVLKGFYVQKGVALAALSLDRLPPGIYYLKIHSGEKTKMVKVVIW